MILSPEQLKSVEWVFGPAPPAQRHWMAFSADPSPLAAKYSRAGKGWLQYKKNKACANELGEMLKQFQFNLDIIYITVHYA